MSFWLCACGARNANSRRYCEDCGHEAVTPSRAPVPALTPTPRRCPHVAEPDALCPACAAEVHAAQAEFKRHMAAIAERTARIATEEEIARHKRAATLTPQTFAPTCAGCGLPIEDAAKRRYEDGRLWHHACWERERARQKHQRKAKAADGR